MSWYFRRTPKILTKFFPDILWRAKSPEKVIYLTFDDGPHAEATEIVLQVLKERGVNASFFCIGNNLKTHEEIAKMVIDDGHLLANHSCFHENGWKTEKEIYLDSVDQCQDLLSTLKVQTNYFRPPYGKFTLNQLKALKNKYKIVMWTLLSGDFDSKLDEKKCLQFLCDKTQSGDIVVFHDNEKSMKKVEYVLPGYIDFCIEQGFEFRLISEC